MIDERLRRCVICGKPYTGHGNYAQPVNDGRCCDHCCTTVVMPVRLAEAKQYAGNRRDKPN
jgi:hypothetical protein